MPLIQRSSINPATHYLYVEDDTDRSYMTDSDSADHDYTTESEMGGEESGSDSALRDLGPRATRHHVVETGHQAGQPLGPYKRYSQPHLSSDEVPPAGQHGPNQGPVPGLSPSHYPDENMNYAFGRSGQGNTSAQPTNLNHVAPMPRLPSRRHGGYSADYSTGHPSQYMAGHVRHWQNNDSGMSQMHLNPPPPPPHEAPPAAPETSPETPPETDRDNARLEAQLAVLTAQMERREQEDTARKELEETVQQLKKKLEEAKEESSREVEQARLQGERDARQKIEEERHAELEKQMQLAKQRIEIESEVKVRLEAENLARIVQEETQRRQLEESRSEALEYVLDRLDDVMTHSQESILGDDEMGKEPAATLTTKPDRELLLAELKTSIASHLRQSLILSEPEQINDHISLLGRGSRSRSPRHQVECVTVPGTPSSRSPNGSVHSIGPGDWTGDLPPVPDAPRKAYESEEENDDLASHSGCDDYGDYDSMPGYRTRQNDSRRHYGTGMNGDYQDGEHRKFETLVHRAADVVMERLRVPNWDGPMHTAPYDRQWGHYYPDLGRKPSRIGHYSDSFDKRRPYGDVADRHDDRPRYKKPKYFSRPYKPDHLRGKPIGAGGRTSLASPWTSLNTLPLSIAEKPNISEENHARARLSVVPKLLKNSNSVKRGTESMTDHSTIQGSTESQNNGKGVSDWGKD